LAVNQLVGGSNPPTIANAGLAQLVERLPCKQDVSGSIPLTGTNTTGKSIGRIGDTDPQARKSIESDQCSYRCEEVQLFEATRR
jgi:hypothetical protein